MDSLSDLQGQNPDKGMSRYCPTKFPPLLPQVQKGDQDQCGTTENGIERRARRMKRRASIPTGRLALLLYAEPKAARPLPLDTFPYIGVKEGGPFLLFVDVPNCFSDMNFNVR